MKKARYVIVNNNLLGSIVVGLFLVGFALDFLLPLDLLGPRSTPGMFVNVIVNALAFTLYYRTFFYRLADRYPAYSEKIKKLFDRFALCGRPWKKPWRWPWAKDKDEQAVDLSTCILPYIEGDEQAEQISREWSRGIWWRGVVLIGWGVHFLLLLLLANCAEAAQGWLWPSFHLFGK